MTVKFSEEGTDRFLGRKRIRMLKERVRQGGNQKRVGFSWILMDA